MLTATRISSAHPLPFPLRSTVTVQTDGVELAQGRHDIEIAFETRPFGRVRFKVQDAIGEDQDRRPRIPRDERDDYAPEIVRERQAFVEEASGVKLRHLAQYSFDPHRAKGNCENFTGAAQVPGLRRAAANRRRARARRFSNSAGHIRGHAGGFLQSRHEGAECVRRREGDGGGRCHAARARVRVFRRAGGPRFCALGGWQPGANPAGGRSDIIGGQAVVDPTVAGQQVRVGPRLQPATGFWTTMPGLRTSIWNPISPRIRRDHK